MNILPVREASRPRLRPERGQAMVEFVVAATFFLVPLFLAMVVLGKLNDVQHTTSMAARYAAWERTVWYDDDGSKFAAYNGINRKNAAQISNEIGVRLINDRSLAVSVIRNGDKSATTFANGVDPLWRDNAHIAYLEKFDQQQTGVAREAPTRDIAGRAIGLIKAFPLPSVVSGTIVPPVPTDTLAVASVNFKGVGKNSQAYARLWPKATVWGADWTGLDFAATGAILSNTWYANGSDSTRQMVEESVPMAKGFGEVAGRAISAGMKLWDPFGEKPQWGKVAPDVVPGDRLK